MSAVGTYKASGSNCNAVAAPVDGWGTSDDANIRYSAFREHNGTVYCAMRAWKCICCKARMRTEHAAVHSTVDSHWNALTGITAAVKTDTMPIITVRLHPSHSFASTTIFCLRHCQMCALSGTACVAQGNVTVIAVSTSEGNKTGVLSLCSAAL